MSLLNCKYLRGFTEVGGRTADVLQKVELSIIPNQKCRDIYKDVDSYNINNKQLCAGEQAGGKDTCQVNNFKLKFLTISKKAFNIKFIINLQGDSGGPLQVALDNNKCMFSIIGITRYVIITKSKN